MRVRDLPSRLPALPTQTAPPPEAIGPGSARPATASTTWFVFGSITATEFGVA